MEVTGSRQLVVSPSPAPLQQSGEISEMEISWLPFPAQLPPLSTFIYPDCIWVFLVDSLLLLVFGPLPLVKIYIFLH